MTSDVLVQELVTKVLSCCHDLVNPFLWGLSAACEPRLSMFWVANINLVIKVRMHSWNNILSQRIIIIFSNNKNSNNIKFVLILVTSRLVHVHV